MFYNGKIGEVGSCRPLISDSKRTKTTVKPTFLPKPGKLGKATGRPGYRG